MSGEERALLRAVVASPDDDAPRLIYADWLEENGRAERAEFIRLQIDRPSRHVFRKRDYRLARRHELRLERSMEERLPKIDGVRWGHLSRGFPDGVTLTADADLAAADDAAQYFPIVQTYVTCRTADGVDAALRLSVVNRARSVVLHVESLESGIAAEVLAVRTAHRVCRHPWSDAVRSLTIADAEVTMLFALVLAQAPRDCYFPEVRLAGVGTVGPEAGTLLRMRFGAATLFGTVVA